MLNKINYIPNETIITAKNLNEIQDEIINIANIVYPIGSLYFSMNNTSPAVLFGGTWEQIKDRFLLAAGDKYDSGTTGGNANNSHIHIVNGSVGNHTLTVAEMPSHVHPAYIDVNFSAAYTGNNNSWKQNLVYPNQVSNYNNSYYNIPQGGNQPHNHPFSGSTQTPSDTNNMPPYLAIYIWKRIS